MSVALGFRRSGWQGSLPPGWSERRLGDLVTCINGHPFASDDFGPSGHTPIVRIRDLLAPDLETFTNGSIPARAMIRDGDVVIGMDGDFNVVRWTRGPAALNQRLCLLRPRLGVDIRFIYYALPDILQIINDLTFSTTVKHLASGDLLAEKLPMPSLEEQSRIADFLDVETAHSDRLLALRAKQNDLLSVAQTARVESCVQELLADSTLVPLKYLVRESDLRLGSGGAPTLLSVSIYVGVVPRAALTDREGRADELSAYKLCWPGDLVLNRMRAFQGGVGVCREYGIVSPDYTVLHPNRGVLAEYLHFLMRSPWFVGEMASRVRGIGSVDQGNVRTPRVNFSDLGLIRIPLPSELRQSEVIGELASGATRTLKMGQVLRSQSTLLAERRTALISAAVTGQLDVTTSQGAA